MPISIKPETKKEFQYSEWTIGKDDRKNLVNILAYLYLQQEKNAQRVIQALTPRPRPLKGKIAENVIRKLTAPKQADVDIAHTGSKRQKEAAHYRIQTSVWHRDGLLFQHISWIVASLTIPGGYMTSPHVRQADKGFDGFIIELDAKREGIERIILCEDKASEKPRTLVRKSVWPEISSIICGDRDDEIHADLTTLLKGIPDIDAESAVDEIFWEGGHHFRVSVATGEKRRKAKSFMHIMKGFEDKVPGSVEKRIAGVLAFDDVRDGLALLAQEVIARVEEMSGV